MKGSASEQRSEEAVRAALSALARRGLSGLGSEDAQGLLALPSVRRATAGSSGAESALALRDHLLRAIEEIPTRDYHELLRIVLQLDPRAKGLSAGQRRDLAGRRFRGGAKPVAAGTVRQYHEPRALDQLAAALIALDGSKPPPRRVATVEQILSRAADFGDPDGARAAPSTVIEGFVPVEFGGDRAARVDPDVDRRARVIVGRKGSGKTLYLRRLNLDQRRESSIYADLVSSQMPSTDQIVRFDRLFPEAIASEAWSGVWRVAILRSAISHVLNASDLSGSIDPDDLLELRRVYRELGGSATIPRAIGAELQDLLFDLSHRAKVDRALTGPTIDEAEHRLGFHLRYLPPMHFFLDGLDDEFSHAPVHWLRCQEGLFRQVMSVTRNDRLSRLHLTVALRDLVYASVSRSEHASRYQSSPYVLHLRWTDSLARGFLEEKVRRLEAGADSDGGSPASVEDWLGMDQIFDSLARQRMPLTEYLVRNTRALPRDIVVLGNMLCNELAAAGPGVPLNEEAVRRATLAAARSFGWEQLAIAATQITSMLMPSGSRVDDYTAVYGEGTPYAKHGEDQLVRLLSGFARVDELSSEDLARLSSESEQTLEFGDLVSLLWENDLLGAVGDGGLVSFRYQVPGEDQRAPVDASSYRLHPILMAALHPPG
jgi:hypothetical protein